MKYKIVVEVDHFPPDSLGKLELIIRDGFNNAGMGNTIDRITVTHLGKTKPGKTSSTSAVKIETLEKAAEITVAKLFPLKRDNNG